MVNYTFTICSIPNIGLYIDNDVVNHQYYFYSLSRERELATRRADDGDQRSELTTKELTTKERMCMESHVSIT